MMPSPPGLLVLIVFATWKPGFQLLTVQTLPALASPVTDSAKLWLREHGELLDQRL